MANNKNNEKNNWYYSQITIVVYEYLNSFDNIMLRTVATTIKIYK